MRTDVNEHANHDDDDDDDDDDREQQLVGSPLTT